MRSFVGKFQEKEENGDEQCYFQFMVTVSDYFKSHK